MSEEKEAVESTSCTSTLLSTPETTQQIQSNQNNLAATQFSAAQIQSGQANLSSTTLTVAQMQTPSLATTPIQSAQLQTQSLVTSQLQGTQIQSATLGSTQVQGTQIQMQAATPSPQAIVPQASQVQQQQSLSQNNMVQVMSQGPQTTPSHAVQNNMPPQSPQQYYVHTSVGTGMQGPPGPPAIAPAPGPQTTTTTTVSALHQPLMHHIAPQPLTHPGVSPSPMPQFSPQVQVIQGGIPGAPYLQQVYQNAQGQIIMPSNLTIQPGMSATPIQQGTLNPLNSSIQVITAGKPFQGQLAPHMIAGGKTGVIQQGQGGYSHPSIPTSVNQTVLIGQLGGQLGVISSQPPNILPAHSANQKAGDMHKVNNMQTATFGQLQPSGITWAPPGGALHSPTLLAQNTPIFIRGSQPGQENLYIQSAPTQPMTPNNAMVQSLTSMGQQQNKLRSALEPQANIQPKVASMRPQILPSGAQIRPGASVSTQTATGQPIAPAQMVAPRSQVQKYINKVRKNASNRMASSLVTQQQQQQQQQQQHQLQQPQTQLILQQAQAQQQIHLQPQLVSLPTVSNIATSTIVSANGSMPTLASIQKTLNPASPMEAMSNMAQNNRQGSLVHPPTVPVQGAHSPHGVKVPTSKATSAPSTTFASSSVLTKLSNIVATVASAVEHISTPTASRSSAPLSSTLTSSSTTMSSTIQAHMPQVNGISSCSTTPAKPTTPVDQTTQGRPMENEETSGNDTINENCITWKAILPSMLSNSSGGTVTNGSVAPVTTAGNLSNPNANVSLEKETNGTLTNGNEPTNEKSSPVVSQNNTGPPKAMVKPQVLTHVIEGFVIHEASEPFPVNRSSILNDISKVRTSTPANTATVLPQGSHPKNNNDTSADENDLKKESPKGEVSKCEFCGRSDVRSKYKKSKRFCSSACSKRFNEVGSKRIGLYSATTEDSPNKKLKEDSVISGFQPTENEGDPPPLLIGGEISPDDMGDTPKVDILKWTVRDVVEFIQNLPGCQDYAEDFELQEIDGQALMLLKADHLMSAMSMKLGPALKICSKIDAMRSDRKES